MSILTGFQLHDKTLQSEMLNAKCQHVNSSV